MAINYAQSLGPSALDVGMNTAGGLQGLQVTRMEMDAYRNQQAQEQKKAQARQEFAGYLQGDDVDQVARMAAEHPDLRDEFAQAVDFQDKITSRPRLQLDKDIISGNVDPRSGYEQRVMEIESKGGQAPYLRKTLEISTDEQLFKTAEKGVAMKDSEAYKSYRLASFGGGMGELKPTARMQEFSILDQMEEGPRKDAFSRMVGAEDTVKIKGIEYRKNPLTNQYEAALDATSETVSSQEKALADIEADKKSRMDFSTNKGKWRAGKPKFKSKIKTARAGQDVIAATANEIRNNVNDWTTKYGASLSALPGSQAQTLKGQINTLLANSAFSSLIDLKQAGGTLGAISSSELDLLKAKLGELNQKGDAGEMLRVLDQIEEANEKSINIIEEEYKNTDQMYSVSYDQMVSAQEVEQVDQGPPPATNHQGWRLHTDANGNQAYVGPNGEIEEL